MFTDPELHAISKLEPSPCYDFIFPKERFDLRRVSYYFEHDMSGGLPDAAYDCLFQAVAAWKNAWRAAHRPSMVYEKSWDTIRIVDRRTTTARSFVYTDLRAALYEFCEDAQRFDAIVEKFGAEAWVQSSLSDFVEAGLMIHLDERYLSLALPMNPNH